MRRLWHQSPWTPPSGEQQDAGGLAVRVLGSDGPPILLLHGLVGSGRYWGGAYDRLADTHRLIVADLPGFGRSPHPPTGYGPDDHARAVIGCLDALEVDEPVLIGAHSLGSLVALRLAATFPDRVSAVVAFGPPIYPDPATARRRVARTGAMARLFVASPWAHSACRWVCDHRPMAARLSVWSHPQLPAPVAADGVLHTWASYSETLQRVILAAEAHQWLADIAIPVHLVAGRSDRVVDLPFLTALAHAHTDVDVDVWPGGHDLPLVQPQRCAALIEAVGVALAEHQRTSP